MKSTKMTLCTLILLCISIASGKAEGEKDSLKILFIGNSYTYVENLPHIVTSLASGGSTKLVTKKSTVGGAKLAEHWHGKRGLKSKEMIEKGDFDIVVIQGFSMGAINEADSVAKYGKLFCDLVKENNAKPYFYLTWAREKVPQYQETINEVYYKVARDNDAGIVPVGNAWALARQLRPDIPLFHPDGSHPSELGTFLTASVFVATFLGEIPKGYSGYCSLEDRYGENVRLMHIDALDVEFCKKVTEEIVLK
ncbi:SGNH/GDSL hydrolase family protein [Membranihabitans marinus]|uniref:hypothetical protein n=1 Tax=Membranihabitans marinus TaxID=1227546 RepID=UPI001F3DA105|nr:hypothetical protein [Membranihabitans marinus]